MSENTLLRRLTKVSCATGATLALALALGACADTGTTGTPAGDVPATVPANVIEAYQIDCAPYEAFGDLTGQAVSVYSSIVDVEGDSQIASYVPFEDCTGAIVNYEGSREFEAQLLVRLQAGNPPDIAIVPQPGLLATVVRDFPGAAKVAPASVVANVDQFFTASWKDFGTVDGTFYAAPLGANAKSFVWYSPQEFEANGYTVPTTWTEMLDLTAQMAQDRGGPVWCAGVESGDATGWPGTDWIEDMVLRTAGPDLYRQWYEGTIPFNDPRIVAGWDEAAKILLNPQYVNAGLGGVDSIATTPWTDAGLGLLDGTCLLHRAANFYAAQFPAGTDISENGAVYAFYFPTDQNIRPVLGGGEFVLALDDRPVTQAFQTYLSSADWANAKAVATPEGGWASANTGLDASLLPGTIDRLTVETLQDPNAIVAFDASDMMPGVVGAGTFWTGIVNWLTGTPTQQVVDTIEASWPR
ncbi:MAG: ABC transporter substrate-binding protein [Promicromonosporaceae bacterium]|nr:ABC transporter substrate-binding protein [Promicromonosporaceae bacterium]